MKKTKLLIVLASMLLASALIFSGCSSDDDDNGKSAPVPTPSDNTNEVSEVELLDGVAFTVLRSLTDLTQYDENVAINEEDSSVSGIETLPDDWKTKQFTCDEGFVLNTATPTVRSIPVNGFGDALEFFSGVIGENISEESLENDACNWSYQGLGSLTFKKVSGDEYLFATIDVNLSVVSNLTQLRFISKDTPDLTSANSYNGKSYYHAGDVIRRTKDNTYWICVRPSGGPYKKDKSYWISLDAFDNKSTGKNAGKTTIKTETKKYTLYYDVSTNANVDTYEKFTQEWVYAKNLMSLKTAKAAFHTFGALVNDKAWDVPGYERARYTYGDLTYKQINLLGLHRDAASSEGASEEFKNINHSSYEPATFVFAYGSPKTDSARNKNINDPYGDFRADLFKKIAQVAYVQPFISGTAYVQSGKVLEFLTTQQTTDPSNTTYRNVSFLHSLTDSFDEAFLQAVGASHSAFPVMPGATNAEKASKFLYDVKNYFHYLANSGNTNQPGPLQYTSYDSYPAQYKPRELAWHVIVSPELMIKDNKGNVNDAKRPVGNDYTDIYLQNSNDYFDYWNTFDNCERTINGKTVKWDKENKE